MTTWTADELKRIEAADELRLASRRSDGTLQRPVTIWGVRHGDDLYVRAVNGPTGAWFCGTQARQEGQIRAGGVDTDVSFVDVDPDDERNDQLDARYRASTTATPQASSTPS
jgi:hypothetical protein